MPPVEPNDDDVLTLQFIYIFPADFRLSHPNLLKPFSELLKVVTSTAAVCGQENDMAMGLELLEDRLIGSKSDNKQFDPTIIIAIISALIPLISGCFKPKPASLKRRLGNRARLASAIKKERADLSWIEAFGEADNLFALADGATDAELQSVIDECCK